MRIIGIVALVTCISVAATIASAEQIARFGIRNTGSAVTCAQAPPEETTGEWTCPKLLMTPPIYSLAGGDPVISSRVVRADGTIDIKSSLEFGDHGTASLVLSPSVPYTAIQMKIEGLSDAIPLSQNGNAISFKVPPIPNNGVSVFVITGTKATGVSK